MGNPTILDGMKKATFERAKQNKAPAVIDFYDAAADVKNRISLRGAKTKYFHVQALSNGSYLLEPRVLVPPHTVSARTLKTLEQSAANFKKGRVSEPIARI